MYLLMLINCNEMDLHEHEKQCDDKIPNFKPSEWGFQLKTE